MNLIFRPGFSTAQSVGKVSGRGVGMDVVSTHLAKINGRIEIKTEKGVGTKFLIRLPLTLAIAQALIVKFKDQELAVPMNLVEETTRFSFKEIQRAAGEEMVNLRGTLITAPQAERPAGRGQVSAQGRDLPPSHPYPRHGGKTHRPAGRGHRRPRGDRGEVSGRISSRREDVLGRDDFGRRQCAPDPERLVALRRGNLAYDEGQLHHGQGGSVLSEAAKRKPRVLVVDDSISIRKYVQRFLDRTGYEVEVAPDGMEALNVMGRIKFDAVITDLEMPVMHGYDLIAEMKRNPALMNIPVIVLTSRAGEKHRQKAIEMGAQDYLVKPFEEQEMLGALKKLLSGAALAQHA